jgi:hypothetical protein
MTAAASRYAQVRWKFVAEVAGIVRKTSDVTTPKLPAPAPRSAQKQLSMMLLIAVDDAAVREDDLSPK